MVEFLAQVLRFFVSLAGVLVALAGIVMAALFLIQGEPGRALIAVAAMFAGFLTLGGLAVLSLIEEHLGRLRLLAEAADQRGEAMLKEQRATSDAASKPRQEPPVRRPGILDSGFTLPKV